MTVVDAINLGSSVASITLAVFSLAISIYFFVQTKNSEQLVTNSLAKIEAESRSLQKLSGKYIDRLTTYVTDDRPQPTDTVIPQLFAMVAELPITITNQLVRPTPNQSNDNLISELISTYIVIYHYSALTNYWAQFYLPSQTEFEDTNDFHQLVRNVVDRSYNDFKHMAGVLDNIDTSVTSRNSLANLLHETKEIWSNEVRSVADMLYRK